MRLLGTSTIALLGLTAIATASAQTRWVIVNGKRMNDAQLVELERRACAAIPDGHYWLDPQTGAWGYTGNTRIEGVLGEACVREQRQKSLSERRQLYRPGEILSR
jgi:hypothetical protein